MITHAKVTKCDHIPSMTITESRDWLVSWLCTCLKCGKLVEFPINQVAVPPRRLRIVRDDSNATS
jgi:hypothetical protein